MAGKQKKGMLLMEFFSVTQVIDGDTFVVPFWRSNNVTGTVVRPTGYNTPEEGEPGYQEAKTKLANLILGKNVGLGDAVNFDHDRIVCQVFYNGRDLAAYFPEYQT